jgi:hypothetical protein
MANCPAFAGGTLGSAELDALLQQQPDVREFLASTLKFSDSAYAEVRLGAHFKNLGGARIGPYTIPAKSVKDGRAIEVVLCTKTRFLDRNGKEVTEPQIETATQIDEKLIAVLLRSPQDNGSRPLCP